MRRTTRRMPSRRLACWRRCAISSCERGCLSRPVGDGEPLARRVAAVEAERNAAHCPIQWQFSYQRARTKLADLYPVTQTYLDW